MSPPKRRGTYKPPRNRRELTIAVLSSLAIIVVTAVLIWVLRPNKDLGSTEPVSTVPAATTVAPTTLVPTDTTVAPTDTTAASTPETTP